MRENKNKNKPSFTRPLQKEQHTHKPWPFSGASSVEAGSRPRAKLLQQTQKLFSRLEIVPELSEHHGRGGRGVDLLDAAHHHAHVAAEGGGRGLGSAVGIGLLRARGSRYLRWLHLGCIAQQYSCYCSFCGYYHHYEDYQHFHYHYCYHCHYLITDIIIIIIAAISTTIIIIIIIINILFTHSSTETISFMSVLIFPPSTQPTNLSRCEYSRSFHHNSDSRGLNGLHDGFRDLLGQPLLDCGLRRKSVRGIFVW